MEVIVNGTASDVAEDSTLLAYIRSLGLDENTVVAELNGDIIGKQAFGETRLRRHDRLELLHFVGGG